EGHEVELHAAPAAGLVVPEQPRAMEIVERLLRHLARGLRPVGPLAQRRHERARPAHRLVIGDVGEAARDAARPAPARVPATWGPGEYSSPPQSLTSLRPDKSSSMVGPCGCLRK